MTQENQASRRKLMSGYIMAACGFALILLTAMNYLFGWKIGTPSAALGIIFLAIGMVRVRKMKQDVNSEKGTMDSEE